MCFKTKTPEMPAPRPSPSRDEAAQSAAQTRRALGSQRSTYGNIFTSVLGDSSYGQNVKTSALGN